MEAGGDRAASNASASKNPRGHSCRRLVSIVGRCLGAPGGRLCHRQCFPDSLALRSPADQPGRCGVQPGIGVGARLRRVGHDASLAWMENLGRNCFLGAHRPGRTEPVRATSTASSLERSIILIVLVVAVFALAAKRREPRPTLRQSPLSVSDRQLSPLRECRQGAWIIADDRAAVAADAEVPRCEGGEANNQCDRNDCCDPPPAPADRGRRGLGQTHWLADCVGHDTRLFACRVALPVNRVRSLVSPILDDP